MMARAGASGEGGARGRRMGARRARGRRGGKGRCARARGASEDDEDVGATLSARRDARAPHPLAMERNRGGRAATTIRRGGRSSLIATCVSRITVEADSINRPRRSNAPIGDRRGTRGDGRFWDPRSRARSIDLSRTPLAVRIAAPAVRSSKRARANEHAAAPWRPARTPLNSSSSVTRGTQIPPPLPTLRRVRVPSSFAIRGGTPFFDPTPARDLASPRAVAPDPVANAPRATPRNPPRGGFATHRAIACRAPRSDVSSRAGLECPVFQDVVDARDPGPPRLYSSAAPPTPPLRGSSVSARRP